MNIFPKVLSHVLFSTAATTVKDAVCMFSVLPD